MLAYFSVIFSLFAIPYSCGFYLSDIEEEDFDSEKFKLQYYHNHHSIQLTTAYNSHYILFTQLIVSCYCASAKNYL